jgi:hypothetical protein
MLDDEWHVAALGRNREPPFRAMDTEQPRNRMDTGFPALL